MSRHNRIVAHNELLMNAVDVQNDDDESFSFCLHVAALPRIFAIA